MTGQKRINNYGWLWALLGAIFVVIMVVLLIIVLLRGNTSISNANSDVDRSESLACESTDKIYPFFTYDDANKRNLKINIVFQNNELNNISLNYQLYYDSISQLEHSRSANDSAITKSFQEDGLGTEPLNVRFSMFSDFMQMTLYTESKGLTTTTRKYFLLEDFKEKYTQAALMKYYSKNGLECVAKK